MTSWEEMHELTGVYTVDALAGLERDAFEWHLLRCGGCASEVADLHTAVALFATSAACRPPQRLWDCIASSIAADGDERTPEHSVRSRWNE